MNACTCNGAGGEPLRGKHEKGPVPDEWGRDLSIEQSSGAGAYRIHSKRLSGQ